MTSKHLLPQQQGRSQSAAPLENAELNEHVKAYLKFNNFTNTLECFEAEINAQRVSARLHADPMGARFVPPIDPQQLQNCPRLYSMLQHDSVKTRRERALEEDFHAVNKKLADMALAARILYGIAVEVVHSFEQHLQVQGQVSEQNANTLRIYKQQIVKYHKLVYGEYVQPARKCPPAAEVRKIKESLQHYLSIHDARALLNAIIQLRVAAIECVYDERQQLCETYVSEDVLGLTLPPPPNTTYSTFPLAMLESTNFFAKHQYIAILSIVASIAQGREYILAGDKDHTLLRALVAGLKEQHVGSVTQRLYLALVHKLSLTSSQPVIEVLIEADIAWWCADQLVKAKGSKIHVFCLEYLSAIAANLTAEKSFLDVLIQNKKRAALLIRAILEALDIQFTPVANKNLLFCLSRFKSDVFGEQMLETLFDDRLNYFLNKVSQLEDQNYKQQIVNYHARIFLGAQPIVDGLQQKQEQQQEEEEGKPLFIYFEYFSDEVTDELVYYQEQL